MSSEHEAISATKKWLDSLVIAHNFCPFARRVFESDSICYCVEKNASIESAFHRVAMVFDDLDKSRDIETALIIFVDGFSEFDEYLDLLAAAQQLLEMSGYEGVYQLASFHPDYCFEGADADDAANYTNRSPYPTLHVLREASVERALSQHPNPEAIPDDNIARARKIGAKNLKAILQRCF